MGPPPWSGGYYQHDKPLNGIEQVASMGPPPWSGGYQVYLHYERNLHHCFNGATALERWIPSRSAQPPALRAPASMGPPPWSGGYKTRLLPSICRVGKLQWGHRLGAVDTRSSAHHSRSQGLASMGPPPWSGGYQMEGDASIMTIAASMGPPPWSGGYSTPENPCPSWAYADDFERASEHDK